MMIVSLGTGEFAPDISDIKTGANYWAVNLWTFVSLGKLWLSVTLTLSHPSVFFSSAGTSNNTHNYMKMMFPEANHQYFRFQKKFDKKMPLDATTKEEIRKLTAISESFVEDLYADDQNGLNKVIEKLLED